MNKLNTLLASALLAAPGCMLATHYEPWVPPANEIHLSSDLSYQWYHHLKIGSDAQSYHNENTCLHFSASDTLVDRFGLEAEWGLFHSSALDTNLVSEAFKLTGRYQWMDTQCGNPFSLATSLSATFPTETARKNTAKFYHSDADIELHISAGKQFAADECATCLDETGKLVPLVKNVRGMENYWADLAFGKGTVGNAWMELQAAGEKQFKDHHFVRLRADYNHGFGNQDLVLATIQEKNFNGYQKINYHAVDLEARYLLEFGCSQSVSASYAYRVFAKNAPGSSNVVSVAYNYAF